MAQDRINYDDIIHPDLKNHLDAITQAVKELADELGQLQKVTVKDEQTTAVYNDTLKDSVDVTEDLLRLTQEEIVLKKNLEKTQKKLDNALEDGSTSADEYAIAVKVGKEELSKMGFQIKNNTKLTLANKTSMTELSLQLAKNRMKYRQLTKAERENDKIGRKLIKTIQSQDREIKKLDKSIGNSQRNVGNYPKSFENAGVAIKASLVGMGLAVFAFAKQVVRDNQTIADSMDFVANKFKFSTASFTNDLTDTSTGFGNAMQAVANLFQRIGSAAGPGGMLIGALFGEGGEAGEAAKQVKKLTTDFVDAQAEAIKIEAKYREEINLSRIAAEDRKISQDERIAAAERAVYLENQIAIELNKVAEINVDIAKIFDTQIGNNETKLNLATAEAQVNKNNAKSLSRQIELNNQLNAIGKQKTAIELKGQQQELAHELALSLAQAGAYEDPIKRIEAEQQAYARFYSSQIDALTTLQEKTQKGSVAYEQFANSIALVEQAMIQLEVKMANAIPIQANVAETSKEIGDQSEITAGQIIGGVNATTQAILGASEQNKELQVAQALINTFAAVGIALATPGSGYSNLILAGVMLATGLANAAKIQNSEAYAEGTESVPQTGMALIHENERILPSHINKQLGNIPNEQVPGLINLGLKMPQLQTGINELVGLQRESNKIVSRWAWVDNKGTVHHLSGDKTYYN